MRTGQFFLRETRDSLGGDVDAGGKEATTELLDPPTAVSDQLASLSTGLERGRDRGVPRGELSTRVLGGFWSISRARSCQNEVRLGEDEVPDDPRVLRTRYSVKILV